MNNLKNDNSVYNFLRACESGASLTHATLFSGIGGPELAAEWLGWNNIFHCEINPFGRKILEYYWPKSISYEDITTTDFSIWNGRIDVLTGGFPCQPYSQAGKRLGKEDDRHLWPEMLRAIREIQPTYIVGENVLGLTNWNEGLVFEEVQAELETEGYEVQSYILPAAGVGAPHQRYRVFIVDYSDKWRRQKHELSARREMSETGFKGFESTTNSKSQRSERVQSNEQPQTGESKQGQLGRSDCKGNATNTNGSGSQRQRRPEGQSNPRQNEEWKKYRAVDEGQWPTQSPVCNGDDGLPSELDGITISTHRKESLKAGGNAIVPQVIYQIYKAISETYLRGSEQKEIINTATPAQ